jgi:nucleoside-diphosphate-sugar epimerase
MKTHVSDIADRNGGSAQSHSPESAAERSFIIGPDDRILVTGAAGFIGTRVVGALLNRGFRNLVCFVRPSSNVDALEATVKLQSAAARVDIFRGNLQCRADCESACKEAAIILHLAAGTGEKSFPDAYLNSVVATRNLLDASLRYARLQRIVLVSSFAVYSNRQKSRRLDESCPVEQHPHLRGEAYCYAKVKQEQLVSEYGKNFAIPYVIVRPGSVYGPGRAEITGRVGIGALGPYLHMGGFNQIPFTYVDNCAEAIVLAGVVAGVDGEIFNLVDDHTPSSHRFLKLYKRNVRPFQSTYIPHAISYAFCFLWEKYSKWSQGQLPPVFNRRRWYAEWRRTRYSNEKLKARLGWVPKVPTEEALRLYFRSFAKDGRHA